DRWGGRGGKLAAVNSPTKLPKVRPAVDCITDHVIAVRRDLHQYPELSWKEERTQGVLLEELSKLDLEDVRPIAKTGATALVLGKSEGPCVLWRADIDALPVPEKTDLPFASRNEGVMHACGHDTHAAIGLGLAQLASEARGMLAGSARFVFQPAEEASGGAALCISEGILENPKVDFCLGLHISADVPVGEINVAAGPFFASPTSLRIKIQGQGGHAASPHQAVDAVVVAAHVITALQTVVSRALPPLETAVLTIGKLEAGFRGNVIAESAELRGTIRTYNDRVRTKMLARVEEIVSGVCAAFGATAEIKHTTSCPPLVNDEKVTAFVQAEGESFFGMEARASQGMGAEDMAYFLEERPGCYFWLGARKEVNGVSGRHHDPGFIIDEGAIPLGMEFGMRLIEGSLAKLSV
ncbi:MAG TPA: amidohydrolase, partial [Dehalococcoidia bacterium]|nr:amidohydrolase [Dehalococcoidia bacterium]